MEFAGGGCLKPLIPTGVTEEVALRILRQLSSALQYLHRLKVIHRDVKPANVLLSAEQDVKLADFGVAAVAASTGGTTSFSGAKGTAFYFAPEQADGRTYGRGVDVWALGCILLELASAVPLPGPIHNATAPEVIERRHGLVTKASQRMPWAPSIAARMLEQDPSKRISANDVALWLRQPGLTLEAVLQAASEDDKESEVALAGS
eukprot:CAMPEP_0113723680 /NCGR_PEP_ID=MMETSP0038_2-20120614/38586_1 /TAXON_ID=2898 /ORGANISM="Cryptomonas paramecium" /LENGTH=204 /DNA_ID=CAMNT_0000653353 /DNA_START=282 /DNA_END=892 /DNA_ORIENTATION=- /assembly_acc=CAM_ASM_000170